MDMERLVVDMVMVDTWMHLEHIGRVEEETDQVVVAVDNCFLEDMGFVGDNLVDLVDKHLAMGTQADLYYHQDMVDMVGSQAVVFQVGRETPNK